MKNKVVDQQLRSNDCGISVVKSVFNLFGVEVSRNYIEEGIPLDEKGASLKDINSFLNAAGFLTELKLLDVNSMQTDLGALKELIPFILPIENPGGLHYLLIKGLKRKKLEVWDPDGGKTYFLSLQELKKRSYYSKSSWDLATTQDKLYALCSENLEQYNLNIKDILETNDHAEVFNKLTYFNYLTENFGFKDSITERNFLIDLLKNQDISTVPKHFKTLKYNRDKIKIKAPLILIVKNFEKKDLSGTTQVDQNLYWLVFKKIGNFKKIWYIYIFAALFSASIAQIGVFSNQILIDNILPAYNLNLLVVFAIGLMLYKIFDLVTSIFKSFVGIHLANVLDRFFLYSFEEKINKFSLPYIQSYKKGDLIERVSDSLKLKTFFLRFFTSILVDISVAVYSLAILFFINWKISLIVFLVMILFYLWFKAITPYLKQNERIRYIKKAAFLSKMFEKVEGIQVIKSFKIEYYQSNKVLLQISEYLKIQLKNGYVDLINKVVISLIISISSVVIVYMLSKAAIANQLITLGQVITFISLSGRIFSSLKSILDENLTLQENEVILKRHLDFNENSIRKIERQGLISDFKIDKLELENLFFGYSKDIYNLEAISLTVNSGEKILIEGKNGSGKSTLSKILTALYEPDSGSLMINDINRNFYDPDKLGDKILLVTNEDILFNDTLQDNICFGKEISVAKILDLAKKIGLYEFIASKDEGLDFIVSENGKNLSTGQRKKILLLRAFFSGASFIIFDEVLSGMDIESREKTETLISDDQHRTFIIISHEPITNIHFSKKLNIQNGKLSLSK